MCLRTTAPFFPSTSALSVETARPRLSELHQQLVQHSGDTIVEIFRTVVAVEPEDPERILRQDLFQDRYQMVLADGLAAAQHFPLRHRVHTIDVIGAGLAVLLPLMYGVHSQVAGLALRIRFASLGDGNSLATCRLDSNPPAPIAHRSTQVVQMRH